MEVLRRQQGRTLASRVEFEKNAWGLNQCYQNRTRTGRFDWFRPWTSPNSWSKSDMTGFVRNRSFFSETGRFVRDPPVLYGTVQWRIVLEIFKFFSLPTVWLLDKQACPAYQRLEYIYNSRLPVAYLTLQIISDSKNSPSLHPSSNKHLK